MTENIKIRTEDVYEILDTKIKTTSAHPQLDVTISEFYDSVLNKIAARSPTLLEKNGLDAAQNPSATNWFITLDELNTQLDGKVPWKTIGPVGTEADFTGNTDAVFTTALASGAEWIYVLPFTYVFSSTITIPSGVRLQGVTASATIVTSDITAFSMTANSSLAHMSVINTAPGGIAISVVGDDVELQYLMISALNGSKTVNTTADGLRMMDCAFSGGTAYLSGSSATINTCLFDCTATIGLFLDRHDSAVVSSCIFKAGVLSVSGSRNVRVVGNHLNDGISTAPWGINFQFNPPDVNATTNLITHTSHRLVAGDRIYLSSTGSLPAPLTSGIYSVTNVTPNTFSIATTTGVLIDITDQGAGVHTLDLREVLFRANTPNSVNNEGDDFFAVLEYIGSSSVTSTEPPYSNNFGGVAGQDLTSRASALDLLIQWRYEERNFMLMGTNEPWTMTWSPTARTLTTSDTITLISAHREANWIIPKLTGTTISDGYALYYVIDRSLTTSDITLTPYLDTLGSIPNDRDNRHVFVMAFCIGNTLWWRGNGGARLSATGGQTGTYFIDGTSKSILDYIGATDVNDSDPNYSNNFAGVQSESLTIRAGKLDLLVKRLFEYTNLNWYMTTGSRFEYDGSTFQLIGSMIVTFGHTANYVQVNSFSFTPALNQLVYATWDQSSLPSAVQTATVVTCAIGSMPFPDDHTANTKYFVLAARTLANSIFMFDGTEIPNTGGRWPTPMGADVRPVGLPPNFTIAPASVDTVAEAFTVNSHGMSVNHPVKFTTTGTLPSPLVAGTTYYVINPTTNTFQLSSLPSGSAMNLTTQGVGNFVMKSTFPDNVVWDGSGLSWVNMAVATSTGLPLSRNKLADQFTPVALANQQGIVVTFTWNTGSDQYATYQVLPLPLSTPLAQNQIIWAQRWGGVVSFA